jgi:hypothetical protein
VVETRDSQLDALATALVVAKNSIEQQSGDVQKTLAPLQRVAGLKAEAYDLLKTNRLDPDGLKALEVSARYERSIVLSILTAMGKIQHVLAESDRQLSAYANPTNDITESRRLLREQLKLCALAGEFLLTRARLVVDELTYVKNPVPDSFSKLEKDHATLAQKTQALLATEGDLDQIGRTLKRNSLSSEARAVMKEIHMGYTGLANGLLIGGVTRTVEPLLVGIAAGILLLLTEIRVNYARKLAKLEFPQLGESVKDFDLKRGWFGADTLAQHPLIPPKSP